MSHGDDFAPAIQRMVQEVQRLESEANELKRTVNKLCAFAKLPPIYANTEDSQSAKTGAIRRDQFFGVALASAVREYLQMRGDPKAGGQGAATVNEIFSALKEGGYNFDTKNDENAKRGLRISLAKNVAAFTKVPGAGEGAFGLTDWYPNLKSPKGKSETAPDQETDPEPSNSSSDVSTADQSNDSSEP